MLCIRHCVNQNSILVLRGGADFEKYKLFLQAVKVNIWDTAGQEEFENLRT